VLVTPVKGLRMTPRDEVLVGPHGVVENRRFLVVDERGRMVNGKQHGALQAVVADYSHEDRRLTLQFPDGHVVTDLVTAGEPLTTSFFSGSMPARAVEGPWAAALSAHLGLSLRLLESDLEAGAVDRGTDGTVSLVSRATLARVAAEDGLEAPLDARRFRMLFEIDGVGAHVEDGWLGRPLRLGDAVIVLGGHTGRCVVTTRDPESGERSLDTLGLLARYRRDEPTTEPLACGVHGSVLTPGRVRVGDAVEPL
jgi:uncharacterized protein YcbX